jgi:ElaB/YqjD/DUF883 family membrane-anchored ribosome-binding protein
MTAQARGGDRGEINEAMRHATAKLSQDLARTAEDARSAAAELATAIGRWATDFGGEALSSTRRAVEARVRRHPITWVAAAAGLGALAGLLLARRH